MAERPTPDERRFRALTGSSVEHVTEIDARGNIVYVSPDSRPDHDRDALGLHRVHPEDRDRVAHVLGEVLRTGQSERECFRITTPDGGVGWLEATMTAFQAENDERHALIVSRDITEARQLEESLRESRERFRRVAENAYDMIAEYDDNGRLLYCNDRVWTVLGFGENDRDRDFAELMDPADRERLVGAYRKICSGEADSVRLEHRVQRADTSWCWVESTMCARESEDGAPRPLIIARDITDRIRAADRLRESEHRHRELIENAPVGIAVVQDDHIVFANPAAASMCGAENPEALVGTDMLELLPTEAMRTAVSAVRRAQRGEAQSDAFDVRVIGLDGRERHLLGVGTFATFAQKPAFQAIMRDVTELEQSRRDQERLTLQLQEARKLESLGVLAGGIAHDFNNLLAVVLSNVRYAKTPNATPEDRVEALCDAEEATENAARLVRQLLDYAGRREPEVRSVDLSELARSMTDLLSTALPIAVELRLEIDPEGLPVHADVVQLEQVLMNLVLNAAGAVGEGPGTVTVRTRLRTLDAETLARCLGGEHGPGPYACLEVEDTGVGMDADTLARIFEPFFSTKPDGHGLGLSAVLGLVQGHQGAIEVRSEPQRGTRFLVALPADPTRLRPSADPARRPLVLLADPDRGRSRATCVALHDAGVEALETGNDDAVMDIFTRHGEELDAAVIDARGGIADARRVLRALRGRRPELPVLALLGAEEESDALAGSPEVAVLQAPFTLRRIAEAVGQLLGKRDPAT